MTLYTPHTFDIPELAGISKAQIDAHLKLYEGYVAQEFIPTWDDKIDALRHAVALCDV